MVRWTMVACGARDANEGRPSPLFVAFLKKLYNSPALKESSN